MSCEITTALIVVSLSIYKVVWVGVQLSIFAVQMRTRIVSAVDEFTARIMCLKRLFIIVRILNHDVSPIRLPP